MKVDYGVWDLSNKEAIGLMAVSMLTSCLIAWLFYDEIMIGVILGAFFGWCIRPIYCQIMIEKRRKKLLLQFQDLLYSLSSSISLGRSMRQALIESIGFWEGTYKPEDYIMMELAQMKLTMEAGNESEITLLKDFAGRSGLADVRDFVTVYECCRGTGGNMVIAMNRASRVIGDKISLEGELHSLLAQKQFEGRIIMAAPVLILLFLKMIAPEYLEGLTSSFEGYVISTFALILILVAAIFMERVNRIEF